MNSKYKSTYIDDYIKYIISNNLSNNFFLNLKLKKNNYFTGEKLLFQLKNDIPFDILTSKVIIKDLDRLTIDSLDYLSGMNLFFNKKGKFEIYFLFKGTNSEIINSNIESFYINQYNVELENKSQNIKLLKKISNKSDALYVSIHDFNLLFLESINSSFKKEDSKNIYTALDIFIKEKFFLLIILLFCLEIYLRKKVGLL